MSIFWRELIKGKNLRRILIIEDLVQLFRQDIFSSNFSVLELGGENASHQRYLPSSWNISVGNYVNLPNTDYVFDANTNFPFEDNKFDGVIFFNTLYAISNYFLCVSESIRVSKRFVIFNVPLVSNIAKHPTDFERFTEDKLNKMFSDLKSKYGNIRFKITKSGGSFSSALSLLDPYIKWRILRAVLYPLVLLLDKIDKKINYDCPMQYLVVIEK